MIKAIITDFDGTLVDTFGANYYAYSLAFEQADRTLTRETYKNCFGLKFSDFMFHVGITNEETQNYIRRTKSEIYKALPADMYRVNKQLVNFIKMCKSNGLQIALASTAASVNLISALKKLNLYDLFDVIISGDDVKHGKPSPDVYNIALNKLGITSSEALVFEDSEVGMKAAESAGIEFIQIKNIK